MREALGTHRLVDQQRALGDLDCYTGWRDACGSDLIQQPLVKAVARKVLRQEVDRDLEVLERTFPHGGAAQRLALDQARQALVKPGRGGALEQGFAGRRQRRARERLGADDAARPRLDQRLVENLDLLVRNDALE